MFWLCNKYSFENLYNIWSMVNTILYNIFNLAKMIYLKLNVLVTKIKKNEANKINKGTGKIFSEAMDKFLY